MPKLAKKWDGSSVKDKKIIVFTNPVSKFNVDMNPILDKSSKEVHKGIKR